MLFRSLAAWLPKDKTPREYYARKLDDMLYSVGVILPAGTIEPGKTASISVPLYAGPQEQDALSKLAPGLGLTVDYGWLTVIALPLFWVLSWLHKWAQNWGVAIILLTVIIKLLFYPLSATSYRSMAKMRVLAPKLQKIKENLHSEEDVATLSRTLFEEDLTFELENCFTKFEVKMKESFTRRPKK